MMSSEVFWFADFGVFFSFRISPSSLCFMCAYSGFFGFLVSCISVYYHCIIYYWLLLYYVGLKVVHEVCHV